MYWIVKNTIALPVQETAFFAGSQVSGSMSVALYTNALSEMARQHAITA